MKYFICKQCELKYPKRGDNIYPTKRLLRKHLKKDHGLKHSSTTTAVKKAKMGIYKCRCFNKLGDDGTPKYFIEVNTS